MQLSFADHAMAAKTAAPAKAPRETLLMKIAAKQFCLQSLQTRTSDSLDFHDAAIWVIRASLEGACEAGRIDGATRHAPRRRVWIPRAVSSTARALSDERHADRKSASTGTRSAAKTAAFADTVFCNATPPLLARRRFAGPIGVAQLRPARFCDGESLLRPPGFASSLA